MRRFHIALWAALMVGGVTGHSQTLNPQPGSTVRLPDSGPESITGRRGWDPNTPLLPLERHASGVLTLAAEELDRVELRVHAASGYWRSAIGDLPLPTGSRLDPGEGTFTWLPGPGFLGAYDLAFDTPRGTETIRVTIYPQGMFSRPQVVIDIPAEDDEVSGSFIVAGWAVDPDALFGPGVEAIHVWAYPSDGGAPIFLGATAPGGERPDVAEIYGARARESGYGISVDPLPPGQYMLAVFGWSEARAGFLPASIRTLIVR